MHTIAKADLLAMSSSSASDQLNFDFKQFNTSSLIVGKSFPQPYLDESGTSACGKITSIRKLDYMRHNYIRRFKRKFDSVLSFALDLKETIIGISAGMY